VAKTKAAIINSRRRPIKSESVAAGKLTRIPTIVEAAATNPRVLSGIPSDPANKGKTGLLDMVELKMARPPITQSNKNVVILNFI
jgi:hypothetical protein